MLQIHAAASAKLRNQTVLSDSNGFDIIYIVVDDKTFPLKVSKNEKTVTITCGITTADCCSKYHFAHLLILDKI